MDEKITYWASVAFSALALILLVLNVSFVNGNRSMQEEVAQRQATINRGPTLNQVNQGIVQALAAASVKEGDTQARDLLAAQGITLGPNAKGEESKKKSSDARKE